MSDNELIDADSKVMFVFVAFAVTLGFITGIVDGIVGLKPSLGALLALLFFYISYRVAPMVLNLEETSFDTGAWNLIKTGIIPYWFLWLVTWTLVYSLAF